MGCVYGAAFLFPFFLTYLPFPPATFELFFEPIEI